MISIQDLKHQFKSSRFQINIPSAAFDQEGITALIGSNGNGKSTLLSIMAGVLKPKSGFVRYNNLNAFRQYEQIKRDVHLLSWDFAMYPWATGAALVDLVAETSKRAKGGGWDESLAEKLQSELSVPLEQAVSDMSRGEIAKLMLLLSLPRNPKVLLIDEITNDLDISSRKMIYKKLDEYSFETGAKIIIATNIISDMERFATSIVLMKKGSILFATSLDDLKEQHKKISLKAQIMGKTGDPSIIVHRHLSWNGVEGILVTDKYSPEILASLGAMGIDAKLEAFSLEEILAGFGE
jgi:ABC-2 type transport system ATP-binding protein